MARQTRAQKSTIQRVMREYKHGELKSGLSGGKVKSPKQAIAIALRESGASRKQSAKGSKPGAPRTKERAQKGRAARARQVARKGRGARTAPARARASVRRKTKSELYAEARRRDIPGRSKMSKSQLARAVGSR